MAADDGAQSLGGRETVFLALAMSIDSLVLGTRSTSVDIPWPQPWLVLCWEFV